MPHPFKDYDYDDEAPVAAEFVDYIPMNDSFWADPVSNASDPPASVKLPSYLQDRF